MKPMIFRLKVTLVGVQGFDVTLLEAGAQPGGLVAGWKTPGGRSVEVGIHGTMSVQILPSWHEFPPFLLPAVAIQGRFFAFEYDLSVDVLCELSAGFWYPYKNIFSLVDELGLQPFTKWTKSAQFSPAGLEVNTM